MKLLLIGKSEASQLFILNALSNALKSLFKGQDLSLKLILISHLKIDENFLFIENTYSEIQYLDRLSQLKKINIESYDYLISIEDSLLGLIASKKINAASKISFKRTLGSFIFTKIVHQAQKRKIHFLSLEDLSNLVVSIFSHSMEIKPKFHLENELVRKNHEMIHWIFNTNYAVDLTNANYVLIDFNFSSLYKNWQLELITNLSEQLIEKFKLKIIFASHHTEDYNQIISSGKILTKESFINSKQKSINVVTHFPLFNHSDLIITNRFENISILELLNKPFYLIKDKNTVSKLFTTKTFFKKLKNKTISEVIYMLKSHIYEFRKKK